MRQELLLRLRPRAILRSLLAALLVLALAAGAAWWWHVPILTAIGRQLVHADALEASDALLVLAGGVLDRELEAADLYARGLAPRVLLTQERLPRAYPALAARGVAVEASVDRRARVLRELGVPAGAITVLDPIVASTVEEAVAALAWARRHGVRSLIVITSSFHTARARYIFQRTFRDEPIVLRFTPASASDFQPETWWTDRARLRDGLIEWQKTLLYRLRY